MKNLISLLTLLSLMLFPSLLQEPTDKAIDYKLEIKKDILEQSKILYAIEIEHSNSIDSVLHVIDDGKKLFDKLERQNRIYKQNSKSALKKQDVIFNKTYQYTEPNFNYGELFNIQKDSLYYVILR